MSNEEKLETIAMFLSAICIEGGCGYDLKKISSDILNGKSNYKQAIDEWLYYGHYKQAIDEWLYYGHYLL